MADNGTIETDGEGDPDLNLVGHTYTFEDNYPLVIPVVAVVFGLVATAAGPFPGALHATGTTWAGLTAGPIFVAAGILAYMARANSALPFLSDHVESTNSVGKVRVIPNSEVRDCHLYYGGYISSPGQGQIRIVYGAHKATIPIPLGMTTEVEAYFKKVRERNRAPVREFDDQSA